MRQQEQGEAASGEEGRDWVARHGFFSTFGFITAETAPSGATISRSSSPSPSTSAPVQIVLGPSNGSPDEFFSTLATSASIKTRQTRG